MMKVQYDKYHIELKYVFKKKENKEWYRDDLFCLSKLWIKI